jgi:hypothetical protein
MIIIIRAAPDGTVYASGWGKVGSGIEIQYFRWSGSQWDKIEERMTLNSGLGPEAGISFDVMEDGSLFSVTGSYVSRRVSQNSWVALHYDLSANLIQATNSNGQLFALGRAKSNYEIAYFRSEGRWRHISAISAPNSQVHRVWSSATATFLVGEEYNSTGTMFPRTYVIRGR